MTARWQQHTNGTPGQRARGRVSLRLPDVTRRGLVRAGVCAGACAVLGGPPGAASSWAANGATGMRLGQHTSKTRVVLDLTEAPAWRVFTMTDPARLVVDLLESDWLVPAGALPAPTGHVAGIRHGLLDGGLTRIVLDLSGPVAVREAFALSPRDGHSWRLVVDIARTGARAFRAGAGIEQAIGQASQGLVRTAALPVPGAAPTPLARPSRNDDARPVVATRTMPPPAPPAAPDSAVTPAAFAPVPARKPPTPHKPVIALDPGHGGRDPGAISVGGIYEKDITLAMAHELRKALVGSGRYRVFMTRERDVSVRLRDRVRRARQANADLFLSLHADAIGNPGVRGLSVYTLSERASDAEAGALAERENKADIILGMDFTAESADVTNILIDLAQRETMNNSVLYANTLLNELPRDVRTLNNSRRYAGFAVLKAPDVPSVLLEMGYLSNRTDEKLLRQRAYRAKLSQAVVRALDQYFQARVGVQGARLPSGG